MKGSHKVIYLSMAGTYRLSGRQRAASVPSLRPAHAAAGPRAVAEAGPTSPGSAAPREDHSATATFATTLPRASRISRRSPLPLAALTNRWAMVRIMTIMARRQPYTLAFASEVAQHLRAIDAKYHALIREKIGEQLRFKPGARRFESQAAAASRSGSQLEEPPAKEPSQAAEEEDQTSEVQQRGRPEKPNSSERRRTRPRLLQRRGEGATRTQAV